MKYGEYLRTHLTSEWSSQYISYEEMKDMLNDVMKKVPLDQRDQYFLIADEEFLQVEKVVLDISINFLFSSVKEKHRQSIHSLWRNSPSKSSIDVFYRNRNLGFQSVVTNGIPEK